MNKLHQSYLGRYVWYKQWHQNPYASAIHWLTLIVVILLTTSILISVFSVSRVRISLAQGTWTINTSGGGYALLGVSCVDDDACWVTGNYGNIKKTVDGGNSWVSQDPGTFPNLFDIYFASSGTGWVVGPSGVIYSTVDGGTTWTAQTSGTIEELGAVFFTDVNNGWVVGTMGTIIYTTNGGTTWTPQPSGITDELKGVYFYTASKGWAVGENGVILLTNDGGTTWTAVGSGTAAFLEDVYSINGQNVWAVGESGTILYSQDNGNTWTAQTSGTTEWLSNVHFINPSTGWAVGENGIILYTEDAGATWAAQASGTTEPLYGLSFPDQIGWAVGANETILNYTPAFNFSLSGPAGLAVTQGDSVNAIITVNYISGSAQTVGLAASGLPPLASASFSPSSCAPNCQTTLTLTTDSSTPAGTSSITITGTAGAVVDTASLSLTVNSANNSPTNPTNLSPANGAWINDSTPILSFDRSDPDAGDTVRYRVQIASDSDFSSLIVDYSSALGAQGSTQFTVGQAAGNGTYDVGQEGQTLSDSADGYYWQVKSEDNQGASSSWVLANSGQIAFRLDSVAPSVPTIVSPADNLYTGNPGIVFEWTATDATPSSGILYNLEVDGSTIQSGVTATQHTATLTEGSHSWRVKSYDQAGNDPWTTSYTFTIDTTAPNTSISQIVDGSGAAITNGGSTASATAVFTVASTELGSSFECKIDDGAYTSCTSPKTYASLDTNSHTFYVRATDQAQNTDSTPASFIWTVAAAPAGPSPLTINLQQQQWQQQQAQQQQPVAQQPSEQPTPIAEPTAPVVQGPVTPAPTTTTQAPTTTSAPAPTTPPAPAAPSAAPRSPSQPATAQPRVIEARSAETGAIETKVTEEWIGPATYGILIKVFSIGWANFHECFRRDIFGNIYLLLNSRCAE